MSNHALTQIQQARPGAETEKYVLFGLANETYGLSLLQLQEIIAKYEFTVLPNLPDHFQGVIGLRGAVIPVLNLRRRCGFSDRDRDDRTRVLVVDLEPNPIGIQVDEVFRVVTIDKSTIEDPPELTGGQRVPFVTGVSEMESGKLVIHLDMQKVLGSLEKIQLAEISETLRDAYASRRTEEASEEPTDSGETPTDAEPEAKSGAEPEQATRRSEKADSAREAANGQTPNKRRRKRKGKSRSVPRNKDMETKETDQAGERVPDEEGNGD